MPATRTFPAPLPIELGPSMGPLALGRRDPSMRIQADHAWRAFPTPTGPATLHVHVRSGEVDAEAWGPGSDWALDRAPAMVGARDDLTGFDPTPHPAVARAHRRRPGHRIIASGQVADLLVQTILGQKVTGLEAMRGWQRLVHRHGTPAPGPFDDLRVPPPPAAIAALPYEAFHPLSIERKRADIIRRACSRIDRLEEAAGMPGPERRRRLTALPGLGPWTAAIIERVAFGDADAVEVADFHIPNLVAWNLAGEPRGDDDRMLELLAPFAPHRGRVLRLLELEGQGAPAWGPRTEARDISRL